MDDRGLISVPHKTAGVIIVTTLVIAPWMFAGTRAWATDVLSLLLWVAAGFWVLGSVFTRKPISLPLPLVMGSFGLVLLGALVTALRPGFPDDPFMVEQMRAVRDLIPGSFVARDPWRVWRFTSGALLCMLAITDLCRERLWWNLFFDASALGSVSMATLGLVQLAAHAPAILWDTATPIDSGFFSGFPHYTVAGAYLNLTWPLVFSFGLGIWLKQGERAYQMPRFWFSQIFTAVSFLALALQGSKAAQMIGFLILVVLLALAWQWRGRFLAADSGASLRLCLIFLAVFLVGASVGFTSPLFESSRERWREFFAPHEQAQDPHLIPVVWDSHGRGDRLIESDAPTKGQLMWDRRLAWKTAIKMIEARPLLGYGLGGWTPAYHHFTNDPFLKTFFLYMQFAHQSFLQFFVEWGAFGGSAWLLLLLGALWRGLRSLCSAISEKQRVHRVKLLAIWMALLMLYFHALFEFPLEIPAILWQCLCLAALLWVGEKPSRQKRRHLSAI